MECFLVDSVEDMGHSECQALGFSRWLMKLLVVSGGHDIFPALIHFLSSKWQGFLLGGRLSPLVLLRYIQSLVLWRQASGVGTLRIQLRVSVRA